MSDQNEVERLRRLREKQLRARDPSLKEKKMHKEIATKYSRKKRAEKPVQDAWQGLAKMWKGLFLGGAIGVFGMILVPIFVKGQAGLILGVACIPMLMALGVVFGAAFDWRDDMRRHMK